MPEKAVLLLASGFALAYAIANEDEALIVNYGPLLGLDIIAFLMRLYYVYTNKNDPISSELPVSPLDTPVADLEMGPASTWHSASLFLSSFLPFYFLTA